MSANQTKTAAFGTRELVFVAVLAALLGGSWLFGFRRLDAKRDDLARRADATEAQLAELRAATAGVADLDARIAELGEAVAFFERKLPPRRQIDAILNEVTRLAADAGLRGERFDAPLRTVRGAGYSEQPITMVMAGDFDGFYRFLLDLERMPRITRVTKLELKKLDANGRGGASVDGQMQATMGLSIFYEPDAGDDKSGGDRAD